jgi:hypothetical protein
MYLQKVISKKLRRQYQIFYFSARSRYFEPRDQDGLFWHANPDRRQMNANADYASHKYVSANPKDEWQWGSGKIQDQNRGKINF